MGKILKLFIFILTSGGLAFAFLPGVKGDQLRAGLGEHITSTFSGDAAAALGEQAVARLIFERWEELETITRQQISTELATIDKLKAGQIKLGAAAVKTPANTSQAIRKPEEKSTGFKPEKATLAVRERAAPAAKPPPATANPSGGGVPPRPTQNPEDAFSAIVTRVDRGPPPAPDPFWTEERKQEAIKNGEPKSGGPRACLFLCGKKN